jgi:hypothetical protein
MSPHGGDNRICREKASQADDWPFRSICRTPADSVLRSFASECSKDLGTVRGRAEETHLRVIAAACDLPYAWFTIDDIGGAVTREDEDPAVSERLEALERTVAALVRRVGEVGGASAAGS